jgi:hypothetical protein
MNGNRFEKARMNGILIPVAGAVIAAALVLFVVFAAAYFGAFTKMTDEETKSAAEFEEPDRLSYGYNFTAASGDRDRMSSDLKLCVGSLDRTDGGVSYELLLKNQSKTPATVVDLRCMLYKNDVCIGSSLMSSGLVITQDDGEVHLSGKENAKDADTVVFYVKWEEEGGLSADGYVKSKIGR